MKKKLFEFLDSLNLTAEQIDDLNFILDNISDFESLNGIELEEERAIKWGLDYIKQFKRK